MTYYIYDADIEDIHPNIANKKFGFIVRCKEDKKDYFVKPSWKNNFHNENEYIAHHIASEIGAPVPDGRFLQISSKNMQLWHEYIQKRTNVFNPVFIPPYDSALFFGVEILKADHVRDIDKLYHELSDVKNHKEFFSQFSLDQYLKNPDRHLGNYFFYQKEKKKMFCLIDFDRLFYGATDWSMLDEMENFDCFNTSGYNADLYKLVDNTTMVHVREYAAKIERLSNDEIDDIIKTMSKIYPRTKPYFDKIEYWIKKRRDLIYEKCLQNECCYQGVNKRGVFSVNR